MEPKKVSKAEVLVLAEKYIKELEKERLELRGENESLREKVKELRRKWVEGSGGRCNRVMVDASRIEWWLDGRY